MRKSIFALVLAVCMVMCPVALMAAGGTISLDKDAYSPNEKITITVEGITQQMVDDEAYVSVYKKGAGHDEYMNWDRPDVGTTELVLDAPSDPGSYEMRLYSADHQYTDDVFVMSVPFQVGLQKQGKITLEKSAYQANQPISITVTGITEEMEKSQAYVAIHKKGSNHDEWGSWIYVKAGDSVVELIVPNLNGDFEARLYSINHNYTDESFVMSVPFTLSGATESKASDWAGMTVQKAEALDLIPSILKGADLTKPITRKEFAAVCVKLYEKLSGETAEPAAKNPFIDTKDAEVLKAYNVGITSGISADKFGPDIILNREQAATMLTRVFKKVFVEGWSLKEDGQYTFSFTMPPKFADDSKISEWARPSVYFMVSHKIIGGVGNNTFAPKATTASEEAMGYASATREQALAISLRISENLGDGAAASEIKKSN
ncbi:MAG: S-layer homology domain-containing protein [Thermoclostridium sp.]|nr:S-layer homology domain-containing protein [Thermoclostridium sp.]